MIDMVYQNTRNEIEEKTRSRTNGKIINESYFKSPYG